MVIIYKWMIFMHWRVVDVISDRFGYIDAIDFC